MESGGLGIVRGIANIDKFAAQKEEQSLRLADAKNRTALSTMKLNEYKEQAPTRESETELKMAQMEADLSKVNADNFKQQTYDAFQAFDASGDASVLNGFLESLKDSAIGSSAWGEFSSFDNIEDNEEGRKLLNNMGIADTKGYFKDPKGVANYVVATDSNGDREIVDIDMLQGMSGYTKIIAAEEMAAKSARAKLAAEMRKGIPRSTVTSLERMARSMARSEGIPVHEAYQKLKNKTTKSAGTGLERLANAIQEDHLSKTGDDLPYLEAMERAVEMKRSKTKMEKNASAISGASDVTEEQALLTLADQANDSTDEKKFKEVNEAKDRIDESAGGSYLDTKDSDLSKEQKRAVAKDMARIEQEFPISASDRKLLINIREITQQGNTMDKEMTSLEAGFIDNTYASVKAYFSNDVKGAKGRAAYRAFQSTVRHALYGSAQSAQESSNFIKAYGSLNEQFGPAMAKTNEALRGIQARLQSVYDLNDPYISRYRVGMNQDELAQIISNIDDTIENISRAKPSGKAIKSDRASLEDIMQ